MNSGFDVGAIARLGVPRKRYKAGERIFLEDDAGDAMYVVLSGAVDVIGFGRVLERVGAGGVFGEMAVINDIPRSAAALASEPTEVAVIDRATFLQLAGEEPEFALSVIQLMTERVRARMTH